MKKTNLSATVTFTREIYLDVEDENLSNMSEEEIIERAVEIWNEDMEMEDILMNKDNCTNVSYE